MTKPTGFAEPHNRINEILREARQLRKSPVERGRLGGRSSVRQELAPAAKAQPKLSLSSAKAEPNPVHKQYSTSTDKALNDERLTLIVSAPRQSRGKTEKEFLEDVLGVMASASPTIAKAELGTWGGWWRNRYRENAAKARKVLAEIQAMIREHRILESPGAAAGDLWKRLP